VASDKDVDVGASIVEASLARNAVEGTALLDDELHLMQSHTQQKI
jgi:hypothetical protein